MHSNTNEDLQDALIYFDTPASFAVVKRKYKALVLKYHPDKKKEKDEEENKDVSFFIFWKPYLNTVSFFLDFSLFSSRISSSYSFL
jgi:hypothetical protein